MAKPLALPLTTPAHPAAVESDYIFNGGDAGGATTENSIIADDSSPIIADDGTFIIYD